MPNPLLPLGHAFDLHQGNWVPRHGRNELVERGKVKSDGHHRPNRRLRARCELQFLEPCHDFQRFHIPDGHPRELRLDVVFQKVVARLPGGRFQIGHVVLSIEVDHRPEEALHLGPLGAGVHLYHRKLDCLPDIHFGRVFSPVECQ